MPNPNTIETWRYQDIQIPDVALRQEFDRYMQFGQYVEALDLLKNNEAQLKGKAYVADAINKIVNGVLAMEDEFNQNVLVYLSDLAMRYSDIIDSIKNIGSWQATVQYEPYNIVMSGIKAYMCIKSPPIGTGVEDKTYWLELGLKGEKGASGIDVAIKYAWNRAQNYVVNDLVSYKNNLYVALRQNVNIAPDTDPTAWLLFVSYEKGKIFVSDKSPANPIDNTIWFHTQVSVENAPVNVPVKGVFKRYVQNNAQWEEMYPATVYQLVANAEELASKVILREANIQPNDWVGNKWTYPVPTLTQNSVVDILPISPMSEAQVRYYGKLKIDIQGVNIILTTDVTPTEPLNIRIRIIV